MAVKNGLTGMTANTTTITTRTNITTKTKIPCLKVRDF